MEKKGARVNILRRLVLAFEWLRNGVSRVYLRDALEKCVTRGCGLRCFI